MQRQAVMRAEQGQITEPMTRLGTLLTPARPQTQPPPEVCWTCDVCGEVPPLCLPTGRWIKQNCECQRKIRREREQEEIRAAWQREQRTRTFGGWMGTRWVDSSIVEEMCSKTFDRYDVFLQPEGYEMALAFAHQPKGNLLFYGDYGVGKTHLEAAICNYLREVGRDLPGGKCERMASLFVSAPQFFMAYEETKRAGDQTAHIRLMNQVVGTPLLIFDDIDKSRPTESRWEIYWLIFDERCKAKRPTIVSTNKREELDHYVGAASVSRLSRGLVAVEMVGDDYRREEG
jgi:DNA replication protein DnaC